MKMKDKKEEIKKFLQELKFLQEKIEDVEKNNYILDVRIPLYNESGILKEVVHITVDNSNFYIGGSDLMRALQINEAAEKINRLVSVEDIPVLHKYIGELKKELSKKYGEYSPYFKILLLESLLKEKEEEVIHFKKLLEEERRKSSLLREELERCCPPPEEDSIENEEDWEDDDY